MLQPDKLETDKMGVMDENTALVLSGKHPLPPPFYIGGVRQKSCFISMDITEDVVKLVTWKILGIWGPGGTDLESLQGWVLKFGEDSKKLHISVEFFVG